MKKNLVTLIGALVFVAILFLLVLPTYNKTSFLRNDLENYKISKQETGEIIEKVKQLKKVYDSRKDEINKLFYVLPSTLDTPSLIVQLEALAAENGLILEQVGFSKTVVKRDAAENLEAGQKFKTQGVNLSVTGSYESFNSFLTALESNVRLMDIKSITFSSGKEGIGLNFNLELEVYYQ